MCGVPHQSITQHIRKLLDAGQRVAIWDQVGEVVSGRLVRRAVTRVLSPGMVVEADLLDASAVSRCVSLFAGGWQCRHRVHSTPTPNIWSCSRSTAVSTAQPWPMSWRASSASELLVQDGTVRFRPGFAESPR